jgi:hypothetical protein
MCHHQHGEVKRDFEFIRKDKDRQLESLWSETKTGDVLPWVDLADGAERLLAISKANRAATKEGHENKDKEDDQEVTKGEGDPYNEVVMVDWTNKVIRWNSSAHHIKDKITENGVDLEQRFNMIFSSDASKRSRRRKG